MKYICILLQVFLLLGCNFSTQYKSGKEGADIPMFPVLLTDNTTHFSTSSIPSGKSIIIFYFSPFCDFCKAQTKEIINHMDSFSSTNLIFMTYFPMKDIKDYYTHFALYKYSNVTVAQDNTGSFLNYFDISVVPYIAIYSRDRKLKQVFTGTLDLDKIKTLL